MGNDLSSDKFSTPNDLEIVFELTDGVIVAATSVVSGHRYVSFLPHVTKHQIVAFLETNSKIQDAFPHLTPDQREFLLTGIIPSEWDELYPPDEDELEDNTSAF